MRSSEFSVSSFSFCSTFLSKVFSLALLWFFSLGNKKLQILEHAVVSHGRRGLWPSTFFSLFPFLLLEPCRQTLAFNPIQLALGFGFVIREARNWPSLNGELCKRSERDRGAKYTPRKNPKTSNEPTLNGREKRRGGHPRRLFVFWDGELPKGGLGKGVESR